MNYDRNAQVSDTTGDDSSTIAGKQNSLTFRSNNFKKDGKTGKRIEHLFYKYTLYL